MPFFLSYVQTGIRYGIMSGLTVSCHGMVNRNLAPWWYSNWNRSYGICGLLLRMFRSRIYRIGLAMVASASRFSRETTMASLSSVSAEAEYA